jgi:hypothetical protein
MKFVYDIFSFLVNAVHFMNDSLVSKNPSIVFSLFIHSQVDEEWWNDVKKIITNTHYACKSLLVGKSGT